MHVRSSRSDGHPRPELPSSSKQRSNNRSWIEPIQPLRGDPANSSHVQWYIHENSCLCTSSTTPFIAYSHHRMISLCIGVQLQIVETNAGPVRERERASQRSQISCEYPIPHGFSPPLFLLGRDVTGIIGAKVPMARTGTFPRVMLLLVGTLKSMRRVTHLVALLACWTPLVPLCSCS